MADNEFLEAALLYASMGWPVFPLWPKSKSPATKHGFKDAVTDEGQIRRWWTTNPDYNIGIATGNGLCVIDVDDKPDKHPVLGSDMLRDWEIEHGEISETCCAKSGTGGMHYYFDVGDTKISGCESDTIFIDLRCDGNYIVAPPSIHPDTGRPYTWDISPEDMEPAKATATDKACIQWVYDNRRGAGKNGQKEKVKVPSSKVKEGEGRNRFLYEQGCSARAKGSDDEMIEIWLTELNKQKCSPPLDDAELRKTINSVCTKPIGLSEEAKKQRDMATARFNHVAVANELLTKYGACYLDGAPAVFDGLHYSIGWDAIERAVISLKPNATQKNRNEVRDYLRIMMPSESPAPSNYIAFRNGVLDVNTMDLLTLTPEMRIPNVIPHDWNPDARSEILDRTMAKISCNNPFIEHNLFEFIGLCMMRDSKYGYSAILLGKPGDNASNGKSTYIKMIGNILGRENYSALDLGVVAKRFQALQIMGKLANLGDDIGNEFVRGNDLAVVKKIITGEDVYTDVKGTKGLTFRPYCTMIFSANEMPKLGDDSEGMMRRMFPIRFNAKFRDTDPDFDPDISSKLKSEECMEAAIVRGIAGLKRVMANRRPTPNDDSEDMVNQIRLDNSSLLQWMDDSSITREDMVGWTSGYAYERYKEWCDRGGARNPFGKYAFGKEVSNKLNLVTVVERRDGSTARVYAPRA